MILLGESAGFAFISSLLFTLVLIRISRVKKLGQPIRVEGPKTHAVKSGVPTLGGLGIILGVLVGYFAAHIIQRGIRTRAAPLVLLVLIGFGLVGFIDDALKLRRSKNEGLSKGLKLGLQILVAFIFAILAIYWAKEPTVITFTRLNLISIKLSTLAWIIWVIMIVVASSNAANLTDGLDGLLSGCLSVVFVGMAVIGYFQFRHIQIYKIVPALDLAVVAAGLGGAVLGFLWFNGAPAKIIMGDTGSLALGGALGALAIEQYLSLLLPILAGMLVVITLSVIIQVASYKLFKKRVFLMAPLHHHFELKGWEESTVIIRFWILSSLFTTIGIGAFFADYISYTQGR